MQALDLFGARARNRTGTPLRAEDFKTLVLTLSFLGCLSGRVEKTLSDFSSDIVTRLTAALGVVAASACYWSPVFTGAE